MGWWDESLLPQQAQAGIARKQAQLEEPSLERGPWEARLRGFGAGALEGLQDLTTPEGFTTNVGAPMAATALTPVIGAGLAGAYAPRALAAASKAAPALAGLQRAAPAASKFAPSAMGSATEFATAGGAPMAGMGAPAAAARAVGPGTSSLARLFPEVTQEMLKKYAPSVPFPY